MIRVNVSIFNVSADRFWDSRKPIPPIQINTNLNLVGVEKKSEDSLEVPFVLTINYNPSIAQISLKGKAYWLVIKAKLKRFTRSMRRRNLRHQS